MDDAGRTSSKADRSAAQAGAVSAAATLTAESGTECPVSGIWEIIDLVSTQAVIRKGGAMPGYYGRKVVWVMVREG